jgi:hypothetical protein
MSDYRLDFDSPDGLLLVENAFKSAQNVQQTRNNQYKRNNELYHGMLEVRDVDRANIFFPKIFNVVETKLPRYVRAAHGTRPYIPFEARRDEFKMIAHCQSDLLDDYLYRGQFLNKRIAGLKIAILHGTSFLESIPYFEMVTQKQLVPDMFGQMQMQEEEVPRFRMKLRVYAPWEVYVDPYATGLESVGDCRYVIKQALVSRREVVRMAQQGAYPGLDIEKMADGDSSLAEMADHWGVAMLSALGLEVPSHDGDVGIVLRYESPERYIDVWNGRTVLRDIPNPYKHKNINLSRMVHGVDPHTQDSFWGIGDAKVNEVLQEMLNSLWNMTFDNHFMTNQMMIYYREGSVNPDALVRTSGNRVPIEASNDRPIRDSIVESPGQPLPRDHYMLPQAVERAMDYTSGVSDMIRGEVAQTDSTASEAAMRKESGEMRLELAIRQDEVFLSDFGHKCLSHIDQFSSIDDWVEVLGVERAQTMYVANPSDLPGGFNFVHKGADRIANRVIRQRNMRDVMPFLVQNPTIRPDWLAMKTLEIFDFAPDEVAQGVIPYEQIMQMQMQQEQAEREFELQKIALGEQAKTERDVQKAKAQGRERPVSKQRKSSSGKSTAGDQEANARTYTRTV